MAGKLTIEEKNLIIDLRFRQNKTHKEIAFELGRDTRAISHYLRSMADTRAIATQMIRARASDLTKRVLDKADVNQALDILSRPNIGVLDPIKKVADGPQIMISVNQQSLGGIVNSSDDPLTIPSAPVRLVGEGSTRNGEHEDSSESAGDRAEDHQGGYDVSAEAGRGLRGSPNGAGAPQGPPDLATDSGNAVPGRQRGVTTTPKGATRVAILNPRRPNSSIHLPYDIVESDSED